MLISCPECASQISDMAVSCPRCGFPLSVRQASAVTAAPRPAPRRKKKHLKLPNGFGSIKKLSGKRRNQYVAYPPVHKYEFSDDGIPPSKPALGYFETWYDAYDCLAEYNRDPTSIEARSLKFSDVYALFFKAKYEDGKRTYSASSQKSTTASYHNCTILHDRIFSSLVTADLQSVVDSCQLKHASLELITTLYKQMYDYAIANNIVKTSYAQYVRINIPDDDESGVSFTDEELRTLWDHKDDNDSIRMILIMIYSGFRIAAYEHLTVNMEDQYFQGGVKTSASKSRIVPIHSAILPLLPAFTGRTSFRARAFRGNEFYTALDSLGLLYAPSGEKHTPHDCRHTFSWLCDKYKISEVDKHLLMGHKLQGDVEKVKYTHRTVEELRASIELIRVDHN